MGRHVSDTRQGMGCGGGEVDLSLCNECDGGVEECQGFGEGVCGSKEFGREWNKEKSVGCYFGWGLAGVSSCHRDSEAHFATHGGEWQKCRGDRHDTRSPRTTVTSVSRPATVTALPSIVMSRATSAVCLTGIVVRVTSPRSSSGRCACTVSVSTGRH